MAEDRSLDEFAAPDSASTDDDSADGDEEPSESTGGATGTTETDEADTADPPAERSDSTSADAGRPAADPDSSDDVEPATATSAWHSDGADCERCGERTERRWVDDGTLVCGDCKTW